MKPLSTSIQIKARILRRKGLSHREIAKKLEISLGSAFKYTKEVKLTRKQHLTLMRKNIDKYISKDKRALGGKNSSGKFTPKYSKEVLLEIIKKFVIKNKRLPVKREFPQYRAYIRVFGTWNRAIRAAGFDPNPVLFAKKFTANDGHRCDSLSEKIIDDWLYARKIKHKINVSYPIDKSLTVDFLVKNYWIEFFGLDGQLRSYDNLKKRKLKIAEEEGLNLVNIYPKDLFPKCKLNKVLAFLI